MIVNLLALQERVENGLLTCRKHPAADLYIWNYTARCAAEKLWDECTLMCRGLITDLEGNIETRCLPKFFNLGQVPETQIENLPSEAPQITDKLDGSLGLLYWHLGQPAIATRGSFESDQARWATKWLWETPGLQFRTTWEPHRRWGFNPKWSYIFEILYKENRVVVDYGDREECVLLTVIDTETGYELESGAMMQEALRLGITYVGHYCAGFKEVTEGVKKLGPNEEGFVCRYSNGLRVKLKGAEYLRLHRLLTQCNARKIWECLAAGTSLDDFLERVPDEFHDWVCETRDELLTKFYSLKVAANIAWRCVQNLPTRKEQAAELRRSHPQEMPLAFSLLDGKDVDMAIWRRLRPAHETPWKLPKQIKESE